MRKGSQRAGTVLRPPPGRHRAILAPVMPANVTPDYKRAEEAFRAAKTADEKIARLEDMITLLPKHKGTDHLFADLKHRLAKLKEEAEGGATHRGGHAGIEIRREGAAQLALVGPTGAGKSSILGALTHAQPEIGDWPFVTRTMQPGMAFFEDAPIQLVDSPAVAPGAMPVNLLGVVRGADGILLVLDLSRDSLLDDLEAAAALFAERHVRFVRERADPRDRDAVRCLVVANKADAPGAADRLAILRETTADRLDVVPCSCASGYPGEPAPRRFGLRPARRAVPLAAPRAGLHPDSGTALRADQAFHGVRGRHRGGGVRARAQGLCRPAAVRPPVAGTGGSGARLAPRRRRGAAHRLAHRAGAGR